MSDAFGPDDSTATGGLVNDMPGIGAAPPAVRNAPSALSGLAQFATQVLGLGRPAPQAPRPPQFQPQPPSAAPATQGGPSPLNNLQAILQSVGVPPEAIAQLPGPLGATARQSSIQPVWPPQPSESGPFPSWPPPWRTAKVQPYVKAPPNRPYSQWGEPEEFPRLPGAWEVPNIYQGLSQSVAQTGSGFTLPLALGLGRYSGAFIDGMMKGQEFRVKMAHDQMVNHADELYYRMQEELSDYRDAFAEFGGDMSTGEGADAKLTMKGVGKLQDALEAVATKYQDGPMLAALGAGNLAGAENILKQRDAQARDLRASNAAREKDAERTEADAPYKIQPQNPDGTPSDKGVSQPNGYSVGPNGVTINRPDEAPAPTPTQPGGPPPTSLEGIYGDNPDIRLPAPSQGGDAGAATGQQSQAQPSPQRSTQVAQSGQPRLPSQGVQVADAGASDAPPSWLSPQARQDIGGGRQVAQAQTQPAPSWRMTPSQSLLEAYNHKWDPLAVDSVAQRIIAGEAKASDYSKNSPEFWSLAQRRAGEIMTDLQRIHDSNLAGSRVVSAVSKVAPLVADDIQGALDGDVQITAGGFGSPEVRAYNRLLATFATKADPQWTPQDWQLRQQFRASFTPTGRAGQSLLAGQRMATSAANVIQAVKELGPGNIRLTNEWREWIANNYTGGGQYTNLFNALRDYVGQEVRVMRGGQGAVYDEKSLLENMPITGSAAQIIGALKVHTRDARATLTNLNNGYQAIVHGRSPTPLYDNGAEAALTAIERMNPNTLGYDPRDLDPRTGLPPRYLQVDPIGTGTDIDPATGRPRRQTAPSAIPPGVRIE